MVFEALPLADFESVRNNFQKPSLLFIPTFESKIFIDFYSSMKKPIKNYERLRDLQNFYDQTPCLKIKQAQFFFSLPSKIKDKNIIQNKSQH